MHVLIYDPMHAGHHLNWVRLLIEAAQPHATRITFATTKQASQSAEFAEHLGHLAGSFEMDDRVAPVTGPERTMEGLKVARRAWAGLSQAVARNRPDHLFVAFADALLRAPLTIGPKGLDLGMDPAHVEGIIIASPYAFRRHLPWRKQARMFAELYGASRLPIGRFLLLTPLSVEWLHRNFTSLARRCQTVPDPVSPTKVYDKLAARRSLGLPLGGRLIGCIGILDGRKGVDEFIDSFSNAPLKADDRLLLAGRASDEVRVAFQAARSRIGADRIILVDRILSDDELDLAVSAVDLLSVTYRFPGHFGVASMLIRAAAAGRPVLSMSQGWPGYITPKLALGWLYPEDRRHRPLSITNSLEASHQFTLNEQARDFVRFHSQDRVRQILGERLSVGNARTHKLAA